MNKKEFVECRKFQLGFNIYKTVYFIFSEQKYLKYHDKHIMIEKIKLDNTNCNLNYSADSLKVPNLIGVIDIERLKYDKINLYLDGKEIFISYKK